MIAYLTWIQGGYSTDWKQKVREVPPLETYCTWSYFSVRWQWKYVRVRLSVEYDNNESATQYTRTSSFFVSRITT